MRKVVITVIKRAFYPELAEKYLSEGREAGPCPIHQEGDRFEYRGGAEMPKGFALDPFLTAQSAVKGRIYSGERGERGAWKCAVGRPNDRVRRSFPSFLAL